MSILRNVLGPKSKYDGRLPYTYEARVAVEGVPGMTQSWIDDTLCGLLEKLAEEDVSPADATLREVRPDGEVPILVSHCVGPDGKWLVRPAACRVFEEHYAGHEKTGRCCYRDRSRAADGPFVEYEPVPGGKRPG
jgi:hypothetical protein